MAQADELERRKRELLAAITFQRQQLAADINALEAATAWIAKVLKYGRLAGPVLAIGAPLVGWIMGFRRRARIDELNPLPKKKTWLARLMTGYHLARQLMPLWDGVRRARRHAAWGQNPNSPPIPSRY